MLFSERDFYGWQSNGLVAATVKVNESSSGKFNLRTDVTSKDCAVNIHWDGDDNNCRLETGCFFDVKKMKLIK